MSTAGYDNRIAEWAAKFQQNPSTIVTSAYKFPFELRPDQKEDIDNLSCYYRLKLFNDPGLGKTITSIGIALAWGLANTIDQVIVLAPPILIEQWEETIDYFPELVRTTYRGSPVVRQKLRDAGALDADFIVTTLGLFKNDFDEVVAQFAARRVAVIVDEAASVRMPSSGNFRALRDFIEEADGKRRLMLLTGTPLGATPLGAYGYIALTTPGVYRNFSQFQLFHVKGTNKFGQPTAFQQLDLLRDRLMVQGVRRVADDVLTLPSITFNYVKYHLDRSHQKLYDKLITELLLTLKDGSVVDATTQQKLYVEAQRFILNGLATEAQPAGFDILGQVLEETGITKGSGEKLIVYANFTDSNNRIIQYLEELRNKFVKPVLVYGPNAAKNAAAVEQFKTDPKTTIMVCNPKSGGVGLNLQMCRYQLFLELPLTSADFQQAVARIKRSGQQRKCLVWVACALGTIQEHIHRNVLQKEVVVQRVVHTKDTIRAALRGK